MVNQSQKTIINFNQKVLNLTMLFILVSIIR